MTDEQIVTLASYLLDGISPYFWAILGALGLLIGMKLIDAVSWWKW